MLEGREGPTGTAEKRGGRIQLTATRTRSRTRTFMVVGQGQETPEVKDKIIENGENLEQLFNMIFSSDASKK
jgi:hypothetical protein